MRHGHQLSMIDKGLLCPDCHELMRDVGADGLACRYCGQVDTRQGWALRKLVAAFPGATLTERGDYADRT